MQRSSLSTREASDGGTHLPQVDHRLLHIVAETILTAHQRNGRSWSLYAAARTSGVALTVNQEAVIKIDGRTGSLWLPGSSTDAMYVGLLPPDQIYVYKSSKRGFKVPRASSSAVLSLLEAAIGAGIWFSWIGRTAGETEKHCRNHQKFDVHLHAALSSLVNTDLPLPTYRTKNTRDVTQALPEGADRQPENVPENTSRLERSAGPYWAFLANPDRYRIEDAIQ
jgi:hypothetical protein